MWSVSCYASTDATAFASNAAAAAGGAFNATTKAPVSRATISKATDAPAGKTVQPAETIAPAANANVPERTTQSTTTTTTKPTTTTQKPCISSKLNLILNVFNKQDEDFVVNTKQTFLNGSSVAQVNTVPKGGEVRLVFDINKDHHKNVEVSYPHEQAAYDFGGFYSLTDANCKYFLDKNLDGQLIVEHAFSTKNGKNVFTQKMDA